MPIWRVLEMQTVWRACSRAWAKTGKRMAARIAMMAMTTSSSMSVKADAAIRRAECMVLLLVSAARRGEEMPPVRAGPLARGKDPNTQTCRRPDGGGNDGITKSSYASIASLRRHYPNQVDQGWAQRALSA